MRSTTTCCRECFCPKCRLSGSRDFATRCFEGEKAGDRASMKHIERDVVVGANEANKFRVRVTSSSCS